ncbi:MAG: helix-turn-helix domain-containing protein [Chryseobacterium cucumeris]|nr:MAG: helix-turn-helix domain-containing protein [Chryseobacterium cucumeris]
MADKKYSTADIASELGKNERTIRRWISDLISIDGGKYTMSEDVAELLRKKSSADTTTDTLRTPTDIQEKEEFPYVEYFTEEEYEEFKKRITEYPFLKEQIENSKEYLKAMENQIEYFRTSYNKQLEIHENLVQSVKNFSDNLVQRNFIEAKEKGLDKD